MCRIGFKKDSLSINTLCDYRYDGSKFTISHTANPVLNRDDCVDATLENELTLVVTGNSYTPTKSEVWKAIKSTSPAIVLSLGQLTLSAASCGFGGSVTIPKSTVTCTHFDISQNTQITTEGTFSFSTFTATHQLTKSNTSGVVKVLFSGSVPSLSSIQYTGSDFTNCFELISYQSETQQTLDTTNTKMLGKKLVRHCGTSTFDDGILCVLLKGDMNNNTSYQSEVLHCPTNTANTVIQINTASYTQTVQFDGVFSQQITQTSLTKKDTKVSQLQDTSNNMICIDKNSLDKQTISVSKSATKLFVSSSFGFENTAKAMKGATDGVSVVRSSFTNCTALLVKGSTTTCESCRSSYLTNVYLFVCDTCGNGNEAYKYECVSCNTNGGTSAHIMLMGSVLSVMTGILLKVVCAKELTEQQHFFMAEEFHSNVQMGTTVTTICVQKQQQRVYNKPTQRHAQSVELCWWVLCGKTANVCQQCTDKYGALCSLCNSSSCLKCKDAVLTMEGTCSSYTDSGCSSSTDVHCSYCSVATNYINSNGKCIANPKNCLTSSKSGNCFACAEGLHLDGTRSCVSERTTDNCDQMSKANDRCIRCSSGHYLENGVCPSCQDFCVLCSDSNTCLQCDSKHVFNGTYCEEISDKFHCKNYLQGTSTCVVCEDGYFRNPKTSLCESCVYGCNKCTNDATCLLYNVDYFLLSDHAQCIPYKNLTNCNVTSSSGCVTCSVGYYYDNQYCSSCSSAIHNCNKCYSNTDCMSCENNFILTNKSCVAKSEIANCVEVTNSKSSKCSFWHTTNTDNTSCITQAVWWVILLIVIVVVVIIILVIVAVIVLVIKYLNHQKIEKTREKFCLFEMALSNVQFISTSNSDVVLNKTEILFEGDNEENQIPVATEIRELVCVGKVGKNSIKVQFTLKGSSDKYEIKTEPKIMTILRGKAIEFEVLLSPLCSCKIDDKMVLSSANTAKGQTSEVLISLMKMTVMSTLLDPDELIEEKQLGEGLFGVVLLGKYRGNKVVIKEMKNMNNNTSMEEFKKEVSMLDKFRIDYVVNFYGSVFIPNKICMVTTTRHLMRHKKAEEVVLSVHVKIIYDAIKGLEYLHNNGILHRDIKPDNLLVFSINLKNNVSAKLTDFGSSRNYNAMMTNMTFTKGIGTPKFMAPEVLEKSPYKNRFLKYKN
ncbi:protein serine/threonine kinase, putative [Entamoeba invadens IP1]|uniref:Protein serine/threonine kinase, putative n=1 Tax=Entamoeba invadens IP1 TaxID=370355 RepID=L7FM88_ENTIV|nr:protein serine/threonine kinase, putative [Entamoeba invadens IP1]ELP85878.1 protein serine/threonine kinase, putative [Entamoeba invadens IP1]|eukprot:XP_004185224.1 protein serine/threonine kinase, putative [Entamoeba invadens IP1]